MRPFPKLMAFREAPDDLVVFFQHPNSGMVVHSTRDEYPLGTIQTRWDPNMFDDVTDDVVIWLTEGNQAKVEEAIATIEKISALKVEEDE